MLGFSHQRHDRNPGAFMKGSVLFAAFAVLFPQLTAGPAQQQAPKARIEGIVLRSGTGEAVTRARVTLTLNSPPRGATSPATPNPATPPPAGARGGVVPQKTIAPVVTDDQGKFAFQDLDEGSYTLQILANGYVSLNYGQRYAGGPGTAIPLKAGQDLKDLAVNLTPAGNISGRIRDRSDQPLVDVPLQLLRYSYDAQGQRTYQTVSTARTNDHGDYRMYWITPGRYYLMAGSTGTSASPILAMMAAMAGGSSNSNEVPVTMGYAFYPGVSDIGNARPIDLQPGAELGPINITLTRKPPTFRIRGRVIDSRTGRPPAKASVAAIVRTPGLALSGALDEITMGIPNSNFNPATGSLEIRGVLPGNYVVIASLQDPSVGPAPGVGGLPQPAGVSNGMTTVTVSDSDVDGVVITVVPAATLPGRLRVDGQQQLPVTMDRMRLQLVLLNPTAPPRPGSPSGGSAALNADGTFRFAGIAQGDYRMVVLALGPIPTANGQPGFPGVYLKEARFEGVDILNAPLRVSGSVSGTLDVVVGVSNGQVSGILSDRRSQPVPVTQVVLVPNRSRERTDLYKTATTDANGHFVIFGITPGDYKLFSWEALEPYGWFDPDVMAQAETRGSAVHVTDTTSEMVDVKLIPREGAQ